MKTADCLKQSAAPQNAASPTGQGHGHCIDCGAEIEPEEHLIAVEAALRRAGFGDVRHVRQCGSCKSADSMAVTAPSDASESATAAMFAAAGLVRRELVAKATKIAALAMAVLAAGRAHASEAPTTRRKHRYGMVIDTRRCVGCRACVVACKAENKTPPGVNYMLVTNNMLGSRPDDKPLFTAKPCYHCEHPPCVDVCPVSATFKRHQDGIVVVDYDRCIGCRYCQTACPYGSRYFDFGANYDAMTADGPYRPASPEYNQFRAREPETSPIGNVRKCTFCLHLQDENGEYDRATGRWPACAKTCTGHAIHFGDFNDPDSDVSRLIRERQPVAARAELGAEPNVVYLL